MQEKEVLNKFVIFGAMCELQFELGIQTTDRKRNEIYQQQHDVNTLEGIDLALFNTARLVSQVVFSKYCSLEAKAPKRLLKISQTCLARGSPIIPL